MGAAGGELVLIILIMSRVNTCTLLNQLYSVLAFKLSISLNNIYDEKVVR